MLWYFNFFQIFLMVFIYIDNISIFSLQIFGGLSGIFLFESNLIFAVFWWTIFVCLNRLNLFGTLISVQNMVYIESFQCILKQWIFCSCSIIVPAQVSYTVHNMSPTSFYLLVLLQLWKEGCLNLNCSCRFACLSIQSLLFWLYLFWSSVIRWIKF